MKLSVKRVYEKPSRNDGLRILVDRLWPRGITKKAAQIDRWEKDAAPSSALRKWLHADTEKRYASFAKKYARELRAHGRAFKRELRTDAGPVTLVTSVKDIPQSHIPTLVAFLRL